MTRTRAFPAARNLGDDIGHVPGGEELPFLDVDRPAGRGGRDQQVGLPAQEGRDLQHVHDLGDLRALPGFVHVGEDRDRELVPDFGEDRQRLVKPEPARACGAGAVRLVERCLVNEADPDPLGDLLQRRCHLQGVSAAFELARPGDQRDRQRIAEAHGTDRNNRIRTRNVGYLRHEWSACRQPSNHNDKSGATHKTK